jgi:hypothetical protein
MNLRLSLGVHLLECVVLLWILSATTPGYNRRTLHIILQKSRPYLEKDFGEPIAAITMDEFQLFTTVSALQRIHESAPNS